MEREEELAMSLSCGKRTLAIVIVALFLSACKANGGPASPPALPRADFERDTTLVQPFHRPIKRIKHIVVIIQENRSFNDLFYGFPGAKTAAYGYGMNDEKIELKATPLETTWDLEHNAKGFLAACDGIGKISGHTLPDERLRSRDVDLRRRAAGLPA